MTPHPNDHLGGGPFGVRKSPLSEPLSPRWLFGGHGPISTRSEGVDDKWITSSLPFETFFFCGLSCDRPCMKQKTTGFLWRECRCTPSWHLNGWTHCWPRVLHSGRLQKQIWTKSLHGLMPLLSFAWHNSGNVARVHWKFVVSSLYFVIFWSFLNLLFFQLAKLVPTERNDGVILAPPPRIIDPLRFLDLAN